MTDHFYECLIKLYSTNSLQVLFKIETKINQSYIICFHTEKIDLMKLSWNYDMNIFRNTLEKCHLFTM